MPAKSKPETRSGCPISCALDLLGDRWSLLVIRDMVFAGKRHYREFLDSNEGIASNILAERLQRLEAGGLIEREPDPEDRRRAIYTLTPVGIDLIPALVDLAKWGMEHDPDTHPEAKAYLKQQLRRGRQHYIDRLTRKCLKARQGA